MDGGGPSGRSPGETRLTGLTGRRARTGATGIDRLGSFSDGVFAISITLLVLDLDIPSLLTEAGLQRALRGLGSELFSFALSFFVIGRFWMGHVWVFRQVSRGDGWVLGFNTLFLLAIAFLPFPTDLLGEYFHYRSAMVIYAVSVSIAGVLFALLWSCLANRSGILIEDFDPLVRRRLLLQFLALPVVFLGSIPVIVAGQHHMAAAMWIILLPLTRWAINRWHDRRLTPPGTLR